MIGRDDVGVGRDLLDLPLSGIGHAGEKIDQAAGHVLVGGLQVQDHGALVLQLVGDFRGVLKALRLYQDDLQLGGGVDVHHLAPPVVKAAAAPALLEDVPLRLLLEIFKFLVLIFVRMGQLFQLVQNAHRCSPPNSDVAAAAEDGGAYPDHGGPGADGVLIIAAHAHG